jgi:hypothetical protein
MLVGLFSRCIFFDESACGSEGFRVFLDLFVCGFVVGDVVILFLGVIGFFRRFGHCAGIINERLIVYVVRLGFRGGFLVASLSEAFAERRDFVFAHFGAIGGRDVLFRKMLGGRFLFSRFGIFSRARTQLDV